MDKLRRHHAQSRNPGGREFDHSPRLETEGALALDGALSPTGTWLEHLGTGLVDI